MLRSVTTTEPVVPAAVAGAAAALAEEQWRVTQLVRAAGVRGRWDAVLPDDARWRLVRSGHSTEHEAELGWTPRDTGGPPRRRAAHRPGRPLTSPARRACRAARLGR